MGKYVLAAVLVSSLLTLFLLPVRKGLRRFVGSIGVYALWLFVAISLLLPFPQMVYKAVAGRELFQQQSKFSVILWILRRKIRKLWITNQKMNITQ
jgi:beta-lactamase regulating signal transducer with metallopeptidase domain